MSDENKSEYRPYECEHTEDGTDTKIALQIGNAFLRAASEHLCRESTEGAFEQLIIVIATGLAISGTIIEPATQEAVWETERVLKDIEQRCLDQLHYSANKSNELGITKAKARTLFEKLFGRS
jgi:hypothetical protein